MVKTSAKNQILELCILPKNLNVMKTLFSRPFYLPSEIFCTKAVNVASLYVLFTQAYYIHTYIHEGENITTKIAVILNISLERHRI